MSAEAKTLRQWCETQLKKLSANGGRIWLFSAKTDGIRFVSHLAGGLHTQSNDIVSWIYLCRCDKCGLLHSRFLYIIAFCQRGQ